MLEYLALNLARCTTRAALKDTLDLFQRNPITDHGFKHFDRSVPATFGTVASLCDAYLHRALRLAAALKRFSIRKAYGNAETN